MAGYSGYKAAGRSRFAANWTDAGRGALVIGSLWAVSDSSTMLLLARFYDLWRKENQALPEALRQAQIWLRDTTNEQKEDYFRQSLPEYGGMRMPEQAAREALNQLLVQDKNLLSFSHPFHWAAFGYMGV